MNMHIPQTEESRIDVSDPTPHSVYLSPIPLMLRAISFGIRHLEFDIRMTADRNIVLFHDEMVRVKETRIRVDTSCLSVFVAIA